MRRDIRKQAIQRNISQPTLEANRTNSF